MAKNRLVMTQRVGGDAQRKCSAVLHVAGVHGQYHVADDAVMGALAETGSNRSAAGKLGQIRADFGQQCVNEQSIDTGNLGEVHSEDAIVLGAKVVARLAGIHLRGRDFSGARQRFCFGSALEAKWTRCRCTSSSHSATSWR